MPRKKAAAVNAAEVAETPAPKKRGRKPGSKNKTTKEKGVASKKQVRKAAAHLCRRSFSKLVVLSITELSLWKRPRPNIGKHTRVDESASAMCISSLKKMPRIM